MVIKNAVTCANDSLAIASGIPSHTKARRHIVKVAGDSFDDAEGLFRRGVDSRKGRKEGRDLHVVANAIVKSQAAAETPAVLPEEAEGKVVERLIGIANALDVSGRDSETVGLHGSRPWQSGHSRNVVRKTKRGGRKPAEVYVAAEVEFEDLFFGRAELNHVSVRAHLEIVSAADKAEVVREFESPFDTIDRGVGLAAKVREPGDIHGDLIAAGKLREAKVQAAARDLHAELIEVRSADDGVMLESEVEVTGLVVAGPRTGVLSEHLIL